MKTIYLVITFCLIGINLNAQSSFEEAMQKSLKDFGNAKSLEVLENVANQFEEIGVNQPKEWIADYYAALIYVILNFKTTVPLQKEAYLEKAQHIVDKAMKVNSKESELHALQGMVYQGYITINPEQNAQLYYGMAEAGFAKSIAYNSKNPRPVYLKALNVMYTPEEHGGGLKAACPLFQQAQKLFESFESKGDFMPDWGADDCLKYLNSCNGAAEK